MSGEPIPTRKGAKIIGTLPAGSTIAKLGDGRMIAVHPTHPPKIIDGGGIRDIDLNADDLAAIGALRFPAS